MSQRLPFWRGKGRLNPLKPKPVPVNIGRLERFPNGTVVDLVFLIKEGIIHQSEADTQGVKILGDGKLTKRLTIVGLPMSQSARAAIEKVGGAVSESQQEVTAVPTKKLESPAKEKDVVASKKPEKPKRPQAASKSKAKNIVEKITKTKQASKKTTKAVVKKTTVRKKTPGR